MNDKDVDRIASRVASKLAMYAVAIGAAVFVVPVLLIASLSAAAQLTSGLPPVVAVTITATVFAVPLVALIWIWGRRTR